MFFIPIFGSWLYFTAANKKTSKPIIKKIEKGKKDVKYKLLPNKNVNLELKEEDKKIELSMLLEEKQEEVKEDNSVEEDNNTQNSETSAE